MNPNQIFHSQIPTPIGEMDVLATEKGVCLLEFYDRKALNTEIVSLEAYFNTKRVSGTNQWIDLLEKEMAAYFNGELQDFTVALDLIGTDFQLKVWHALLKIPYGDTWTYKAQSLVVGDLKAIRAVATSNGKNKLTIIVPCHRVIGSDGSLTGFGGGLDRKRFLLNLEHRVAGPKDLFNS